MSKTPNDIRVKVTRYAAAGSPAASAPPIDEKLTLAQKLDDYVLQLGCSNAHLMSVMIQLLSNGKVRVEFRNYSERIMLESLDDRMSRSHVVALIDEYINKLREKESSGSSSTTQMIVVQPKWRQ